MKVFVLGKGKHITKKIVREATEYYSTILLSSRLSQNIEAEVHLVKDLYRKEKMWGCVDATVDPDSRKHREFKIFIDAGLSIKKALYTLGHEMTHLAQYATGKMYEYERKPSRVRWNNRVFLEEEIDYWFSPWEIEARGYEEALYESYINRKQKGK